MLHCDHMATFSAVVLSIGVFVCVCVSADHPYSKPEG